MFETAELGRSVAKAEYDKRAPLVRTELLALQRRLRQASFPVLVLVNGVDGAGKGDAVNLLHEWMDPRWLRALAYGPPVEDWHLVAANDKRHARLDILRHLCARIEASL
jgi:polyphosphate kinase 2 (PPK2 family)